MKRILILFAALLVAGCGGEGSGDPNAAVQGTNGGTGGGLATAPVDYLGALGKAQQSATKTADVAAVSEAVRRFQVEVGRLPRDLNELVQEKYLPKLPATPYGTTLSYDPATGEVKVVKQ